MPELKIYGDIGINPDDITAKSFIDELEALGDVSEVTVRINSDGGSVTDGTAIRNALERHPAKITTINDGAAHSIAAYIFTVGDDREMAANALLMTHGARCGTEGTESDHEQNLEMLRSANKAMTGTYSELLDMTPEETADMLGKDKWMDAKAALDQGFATRIGPANKIAAHNKSKYTAPAALLDKIQPGQLIESRPGESITTLQEIPVAETKGPVAATMKQLRAAFPKASADLLVAMSEEEGTVEEARAVYVTAMEEENEKLKARLTAMEEEQEAKSMEEEKEAEAKAMEEEKETEARAKLAAKTGAKAIANVGAGGRGLTAKTEWQQAIHEQVKAGHTRAKAIRLANKANPGLRDRVVQEANA